MKVTRQDIELIAKGIFYSFSVSDIDYVISSVNTKLLADDEFNWKQYGEVLLTKISLGSVTHLQQAIKKANRKNWILNNLN